MGMYKVVVGNELMAADWALTHLCRRLKFLNLCMKFICHLEKFKEQEFEEKKMLFYFIVELCGIPKMEH